MCSQKLFKINVVLLNIEKGGFTLNYDEDSLICLFRKEFLFDVTNRYHFEDDTEYYSIRYVYDYLKSFDNKNEYPTIIFTADKNYDFPKEVMNSNKIIIIYLDNKSKLVGIRNNLNIICKNGLLFKAWMNKSSLEDRLLGKIGLFENLN